MNDSNKSIYICGSSGMVGSALVKYIKSQTSLKVISSNRDKLDLMKKESVDKFFKETQIDFMIIAAAKVGGIYTNFKNPANFILENLKIQTNIGYC